MRERGREALAGLRRERFEDGALERADVRHQLHGEGEELREVAGLGGDLAELGLEILARQIVDEARRRHLGIETLDVGPIELPRDPGHLLDQAAKRPAIGEDRGLGAREELVEPEPVGFLKRLVERARGHLELQRVMEDVVPAFGSRHLEDVETELGRDVSAVIVGVGHLLAELLTQLRIDFRYDAIGRFGMTRRVGDPVRERAERERVFVPVVRRGDQVVDEGPRLHVVHELGEELVAEREIAEVGDVRSAIGERTRALEVGRRITALDLGCECGVPALVDDGLVGEHGKRGAGGRPGDRRHEQHEEVGEDAHRSEIPARVVASQNSPGAARRDASSHEIFASVRRGHRR